MLRRCAFALLGVAWCAVPALGLETSDVEWRAKPGDPVIEAGPVLRVAPTYPTFAMVFAVQAYCRAMFDLADDGTTRNVCVVCNADAMPWKFERAGRDAVAQWLFAPSGESLTGRTGLETEIMFEMEGVKRSLPSEPSLEECQPIS